jgi:putative transcriptional regulator
LKARILRELKENAREGGAIVRGKVAASGVVTVNQADPKQIRGNYGLSQRQFATLLGISVSTLQNWEQGRRLPKGAAGVLLRVAAQYPDMVWEVVKPIVAAVPAKGKTVPTSNSSSSSQVPAGLSPYFQEYDLQALNIQKDANLIIQRTLEFGTWDELRWLFEVYGTKRIQAFLHRYGERWLRPVDFNYWRKLLGIRKWRRGRLPIPKGQLWDH